MVAVVVASAVLELVFVVAVVAVAAVAAVATVATVVFCYCCNSSFFVLNVVKVVLF